MTLKVGIYSQGFWLKNFPWGAQRKKPEK